jgi:hypothetical protein
VLAPALFLVRALTALLLLLLLLTSLRSEHRS